MTGTNEPPRIGAGGRRRAPGRNFGKGRGTVAPEADVGPAIPRAAAPPGGDEPMTGTQAAELRALARDAFESEAYDPKLTSGEAARRIAALRAKLALQDEPPHTL
jgi:hypothetical protein